MLYTWLYSGKREVFKERGEGVRKIFEYGICTGHTVYLRFGMRFSLGLYFKMLYTWLYRGKREVFKERGEGVRKIFEFGICKTQPKTRFHLSSIY